MEQKSVGGESMDEQQPRDFDGSRGDESRFAEESGKSDVGENIKSRSTWLRFLFMVVVVFLYGISRLVVAAVVLLQFCYVLFTGETNGRLKDLGQSLAHYTYQIVRYLTFNTESRPFPFDADWPHPGASERSSP